MTRLLFSIFLVAASLNAQVSGLSNWSLFIDPGHSQTANMGVNGYSEAESNLKMALHLKDLFVSQSDIGSIWTSRTNDTEVVGLYDRSVMANNLDASWFHSIHSNASSSSISNNVLILYGESSPGVEKTPNGGKAVSFIMADVMSGTMRIPEIGGQGARGDCVFYGVSSGPYLSVNRNTQMPSELSESGFHTNPGQNNLQMNYEYARLVAYSMFWTFLDFHGIDRPYPGILTGRVRDIEGNTAINGATIRLTPNYAGDVYEEYFEVSYTTDTYESLFHKYTTNPDKLQNGFYFFEGLPDQAYEIVVSAPGYYSDTLQVEDMADRSATFKDVYLTANTPPYVITSSPAQGDTAVPSWKALKFKFNRPMNTASVENAFSLAPSQTGAFEWSTDLKIMTFTPDDTLEFETLYTIEIAGTAVDTYNHPLDGNGDGVGGDAWTIQFTTGQADMDPPVVIQSYPVNGETGVPLQPVLTVVYNERIVPDSFSEDLVVVARWASGQAVGTHAELDYVGSHSLISIYVQEQLNPGESYQIRILPGLEDLTGHSTEYVKYINFITSDISYNTIMIDNFDGDFTANWWDPKNGTSGQTQGVINDSTNYYKNTSLVVQTTASTQSMQLDYGWDPDASNWMIRLYLSGGAPQAVRFDDTYKLQAFVYGDGQGNSMRFAVDDANSSEVSPWYVVDWFGWRLLSWDMSTDSTGFWIGDGVLDGSLRMDSFQFKHTTDAGMSGTYYIDDLHLARDATVSIDPGAAMLPSDFALLPNYPNPFNPWTNIPFTLPVRSEVSVDIYNLKGELVDHVLRGSFEAGRHLTRWTAADVASGIYLIKLQAAGRTMTQKITVLK